MVEGLSRSKKGYTLLSGAGIVENIAMQSLLRFVSPSAVEGFYF
jgi:hypothetical protein